MATTDKKPIKSDVSMKKAIIYITNKNKTQNGELVTYYDCSKDIAGLQMQFTRSKAKYKLKKENQIYGWSMYQSFAPGEVSAKQAHEIGLKTIEEYLGGKYQFVIATHDNTDCIHNHIVFNAVSHRDYKRHRSEKNKSIEKLQDISDKICLEYGLSIVEKDKGQINKSKNNSSMSYKEYTERKKGNSWKAKLQDEIDITIKRVNSFDDFIKVMESKGYKIKQGKHISFLAPGQKRYTRAKTIGDLYTEEAIIKRIKNKEKIYKKLDDELLLPDKDKTINIHSKELEKNDEKEINILGNYDMKTVVQNYDNVQTVDETNKESIQQKQKGYYYRIKSDLLWNLDYYLRRYSSMEDLIDHLAEEGFILQKIDDNKYSYEKDGIRVNLNLQEYSERMRYVSEEKSKYNVGIKETIGIGFEDAYYLKRWKKMYNTEQIMKSTQYLLKHGYDIESFKKDYINTVDNLSLIKTDIFNVNRQLIKLNEITKAIRMVKKNREYYHEYLSFKTKDMYRKYRHEIQDYIEYKNILINYNIHEDTDQIDKMYQNIEELNKTKRLLYDELEIHTDRMDTFKKIYSNLNDYIQDR